MQVDKYFSAKANNEISQLAEVREFIALKNFVSYKMGSSFGLTLEKYGSVGSSPSPYPRSGSSPSPLKSTGFRSNES